MARPKDERNTEEIRTRILDAAEKLFADQGFDASGIAEIAKRARVTRSLIYYYFESKDALLGALFERFRREAFALKDRLAGRATIDVRDSKEGSLARYMLEYTLPFIQRYRDVIKVGLVEEMKEKAEGPMFEFLRTSMQLALGYYDQAGLDVTEPGELSTFTLFLVAFPLIGYSTLGEEWCEHTGTSPDALRELVARWTGEALERYLGRAVKRRPGESRS